jgi:hypothetical protein
MTPNTTEVPDDTGSDVALGGLLLGGCCSVCLLPIVFAAGLVLIRWGRRDRR